MSRHTLDTSPFKPGETLFWREDASAPFDTSVTFKAYDGDQFALIEVFQTVHRVPLKLLRRAGRIW
jgi:hypothetical protein